MPKRILALALALVLVGCDRPVVVSQPPAPTALPSAAQALTDTQAGQIAPVATAALPPVAITRSATSKVPPFSHVFIIVMENKESNAVLGSSAAPYINQLAGQYAYAASYFGILHPSLPNYLALTGGGTFGISSDCTTCFVAGDNIANQLEHAGRTWKAYIESMPEPCYSGPDTQLYAQRHNPFIYYDNVRSNPSRCQKIVPFDQLQADLAANNLSQYVWITPNLCHDMHDCPVKSGDDWLRTWVPKILASSAWQNNGVLFITFDEGSTDAGCCQYATGGKISTLVISPLVKPGFVSQVPYDHYSLLRTIEEAWDLPLLSRSACDCSAPMADFFAAPPAP
jgi:phosphatidylinositol-3-phosphatase